MTPRRPRPASPRSTPTRPTSARSWRPSGPPWSSSRPAPSPAGSPALKLPYAVANPMHEAWSWRKVKRKTDRDDALKLARMAALGELPTVPMPSKAAREYRALVQYRDRLVGRRTAAQDRIRALAQRHGVPLPAGHRAWTEA